MDKFNADKALAILLERMQGVDILEIIKRFQL